MEETPTTPLFRESNDSRNSLIRAAGWLSLSRKRRWQVRHLKDRSQSSNSSEIARREENMTKEGQNLLKGD